MPSNARKISIEEFNAANEKMEFSMGNLDNHYIIDNVLIAFRNVQNMPPNVESFEQRMKGMADVNFMNSGHRVSGMQLMNINNNQVLISRLKGNKQISIYFSLRNATNKLTTNGVAEAALSDSTKVDKIADFIVKHVKFVD